MMQMFPLAIMYLRSIGKHLSKDTSANWPKYWNIGIFFKMAAKTIIFSTIFNSTIDAMTILMLKSTILVQGYIRSMCIGKNTISSTFTMNNPIYPWYEHPHRDMHERLYTHFLQGALQFRIDKLKVLVHLVKIWMLLYTGAGAKLVKINFNMLDIWQTVPDG